MRNYFETQRVNWVNYSPNDIIFKRNAIVKKLVPQENILSYTSKNDRDVKMCEFTGGAKQSNSHSSHIWYSREKYKGVHVHLMNVKSEFPQANLDFIDFTERKNSVGHRLPSLNALVYVQSCHQRWEWAKDPSTNQYGKVFDPNSCGVEEGYRIAYGGQGEDNAMSFNEFRELLDISEAVKNFLIERVVPLKNGTLEYEEFMVA